MYNYHIEILGNKSDETGMTGERDNKQRDKLRQSEKFLQHRIKLQRRRRYGKVDYTGDFSKEYSRRLLESDDPPNEINLYENNLDNL